MTTSAALTPPRPRRATPARLLAASLSSTANDQGAALRSALRPTTERREPLPHDPMEITDR